MVSAPRDMLVKDEGEDRNLSAIGAVDLANEVVDSGRGRPSRSA